MSADDLMRAIEDFDATVRRSRLVVLPADETDEQRNRREFVAALSQPGAVLVMHPDLLDHLPRVVRAAGMPLPGGIEIRTDPTCAPGMWYAAVPRKSPAPIYATPSDRFSDHVQ
jgi:hypothetical protein